MDPTRAHGQPDFTAFGFNNLASSSSQTLNDLFPVSGSFNNLLQNQQPQLQPSLAQQFGQSMQQPNFSNPWAQLMQMNAGPSSSPQPNGVPQLNAPEPQMRYTPPSASATPAPAQQNPATMNPAAWMNPMMQAQGLGMNPLALNMSLFPQQLLHDAYAMSVPVGPTDEPLLLTTLLNSRKKKESYKDALNSLHGKSGHSASLWKDYYLDNKDRCDEWITQCLQKEKEDRANGKGKAVKVPVKRSASPDADRSRMPSVKKPSPSHFKLKRESSPTPAALLRASISAPTVKRSQQKKSKPVKTGTPPIPLANNRRATINSMTAPDPVWDSRLPPPNTAIKIPEPPSRAPTPPTEVVPTARGGHKYTEQDREYFIKFIGWHLKQNPGLTRQALCDMLGEEAPHHASRSWYSYWQSNHDLPDKMLAAVRGKEGTASVEPSSASTSHARAQPDYKDVTTSEEEADIKPSRRGYVSLSDDSDSESDSDEPPLRVYTEEEMGQKGGSFTDADLYITAKWIASHQDWKSMPYKQRWEPIGRKYPQRSDKSWAEYYRRNEKVLLAMAKRIKAEQRKSIQSQCARPSFSMKRKLDSDDDEDNDSVKRGRP